MDFGPALFWTFEVAPGNIAHKGIAIRLDDGPGGVSKGRAWMVYDHDTMRVAAATTGEFVDWKGIAFDGSHGTHTSLTGDRHFVNPSGPAGQIPNGTWDDARLRGRDGKPYGPLPRLGALSRAVSARTRAVRELHDRRHASSRIAGWIRLRHDARLHSHAECWRRRSSRSCCASRRTTRDFRLNCAAPDGCRCGIGTGPF